MEESTPVPDETTSSEELLEEIIEAIEGSTGTPTPIPEGELEETPPAGEEGVEEDDTTPEEETDDEGDEDAEGETPEEEATEEAIGEEESGEEDATGEATEEESDAPAEEEPDSPLPTVTALPPVDSPLTPPFITNTVVITLESGITGTVIVTETTLPTGTLIITSPLILPEEEP